MIKSAPRISLAVLFIVMGLHLNSSIVQSARGTPDSPDFGFGCVLDLYGDYLVESMQYATTMSVDWLAITLNWSKHWSDPSNQPDLATLDKVMSLASLYNLPVMIKLTGAPGWAITDHGPSPERTTWFVINLAKRYPNSLKAIELFPGANTYSGWGTIPDAASYLNLFNYTRAAIKEAGLYDKVTLIAAGLTPLPSPNPSSHDLDDLVFLNTLYKYGSSDSITVISMELPDVTGSPLTPSGGNEHRILRHYEEVRQVMLANHDSQGILWITGFHWPSGRVNPSDASISGNPDEQNQWLIKAYQQLRSQLYIGVAFFESLNPPGEKPSDQNGSISLIGPGLSINPFINSLMEINAQNNRLINPPVSFTKPQSKHILKDRTNPP